METVDAAVAYVYTDDNTDKVKKAGPYKVKNNGWDDWQI